MILLLVACTTPPPAPVTPAAAQAPDLVVVLVPGLDADRPDVAGPEAAFVEPFGPPAVRFTAAYAQSPATFVSLGSLLVGTYASAVPLCGLYDSGTHPTDTADRAWCTQLPDDRYTLPQVLALYGYHTALFTSGVHGEDAYEGTFQHHTDVNGLLPHRETPWDTLRDDLGAWWAATEGPHFVMLVLPELMPACRPDLLARLGLQLGAVDGPGDHAAAQRAYAVAAGEVGQHVHDVLAPLPTDRPRWTFLSATNGLSVTGHTGLMGGNKVPDLTNNFLLDRTVHVPLDVYGEGTARVVDEPVELLDLMPTLAKLGAAQAPAALPGKDLLTLPDTDADAYAYAEFGEFLGLRQGRNFLSFRTYQHHPSALDPQVTAALLGAREVGRYFRFHDVVADPMQTADKAAVEPDAFAKARATLVKVRTGPASPPDGALDPKKLWDLRMSPSQGYW